MALRKVTLRPGVNKLATQTLNEGGWSDANLVRFRQGLIQKIGGWVALTASTYSGIARSLLTWADLAANPLVAMGTHLRLYLSQGSGFYDITPYRRTVTLAANPIATTNLSTTVTITDAAHGAAVGDYVVFSGATAVATVTVSGEYAVVTVPGVNSYTITAASAANATTTGGGALVVANYEVPIGLPDAVPGYGWGASTWGSSTWGTARSFTTVYFELRLWMLDHWGEDLVACPRGLGMYLWDATAGTSVRAATLTNAPLYNNAVIVGMPERHCISLGAETAGVLDPMLIRWSDVENNTVWTATSTNSAGSFRLNGGTKIQNGKNNTSEILVWTDTCLHSMQFVGLPYVYSFHQLGVGCGAIGPNAMAVFNGVAYWMGPGGFHTYAGSVRPLPSTVYDEVFSNLNFSQSDKIVAGINAVWNEVWWFYPSLAGNENDSVVIYNFEEQVWSLGSIVRTAWSDRDVFSNPIATDASTHLYYHESGDDANGAAFTATAETGWWDLGGGESLMFIDRIVPDFVLSGDDPQVSMYVKVAQYPNGPFTTKGPFTVTADTKFISVRLRGRQAALVIESTSAGTFWRLGAVRADTSPDGRR